MSSAEKYLQDHQLKFVFVFEPFIFEHLLIVQFHTIFANVRAYVWLRRVTSETALAAENTDRWLLYAQDSPLMLHTHYYQFEFLDL